MVESNIELDALNCIMSSRYVLGHLGAFGVPAGSRSPERLPVRCRAGVQQPLELQPHRRGRTEPRAGCHLIDGLVGCLQQSLGLATAVYPAGVLLLVFVTGTGVTVRG